MTKHIIFDCDGTLVDTRSFRYQLFPGIRNLLVELNLSHRLYVWTGRDRASTLRIFRDLDIFPFFESICTIDDAPPKPEVTGLKNLVGEYSRQQIILIGDSPQDVLGAKNFGIMSIAAAWNPVTKVSLLEEIGVDFIATHPSDCSRIIQLNLK